MEQLHFIQNLILTKLLYSNGLKFSELKPVGAIENNKLSFHLSQLLKRNLIFKDKSLYKLTDEGKALANLLNDDNSKIIKQGKRSVVQCCMRNSGSENEYLLYTRSKHPFFGMQGFPSGKVFYGETIYDASKRELKEETNLEGNPELVMIEHHLVYDRTKHVLVEDKYFYFVRYINPVGELKSNSEGDFEWVSESKYEDYLKKPFEGMERMIYIKTKLKNFGKNITFSEIEHITKDF